MTGGEGGRDVAAGHDVVDETITGAAAAAGSDGVKREEGRGGDTYACCWDAAG